VVAEGEEGERVAVLRVSWGREREDGEVQKERHFGDGG